MDLYDPDRAQGPMRVARGEQPPVASDWRVVAEKVGTLLKGDRSKIALLTPPLKGAATREAIKLLGLHHVEYNPFGVEAAARAWEMAFSKESDGPPRPRLDRADLILGFGAEFMDLPEDGLEQEFALRRDPQQKMSRFIQLEGRLSLTGANADTRIRVRDSQLSAVASAIAYELISVQKIGPFARDGAIAAALKPFSPEAVAPLTGLKPELIRSLAAELKAAQGRSAVLAGGSASRAERGEALEAAVILINACLENYSGSGFDPGLPQPLGGSYAQALSELSARMKAGQVEGLIIWGVNPVYDSPETLGFAAAMPSVKQIISLNDRIDETSALADCLAPVSHALESWGDVDLGAGLLAIQQPVLQPLYHTHGFLDLLVAWGAALEIPALRAAHPREGSPETGAYNFLRAHWGEQFLGAQPGSRAFDERWDEILRQGHWRGPAPSPKALNFSNKITTLLGTLPEAPEGLELQLYPHMALYDGASANNGWLQEFPDPITRIAWGGAVSIAPRRFDEMGLENGDLVDLELEGLKLSAPAYRHAGMHQDQIALPLGLGRGGDKGSNAGSPGLIGVGVGINAFPAQRFEGERLISAGLSVKIKKNGASEELAIVQGSEVLDRASRALLPTTSLEEYKSDPKAGTEQPPGGPSIWEEHKYEGQRWEMAIDLSKCNGCGKCTIGCQAENNIPVVGKQGIIDGREMSWIRIDRYYDAPPKKGGWGDDVWDGPLEVVEEPRTLFEPMLCQHCENAPCETVCPFIATMHSEDGLNQQIYNRCVGTRYCANNCPFKVRRYNWFEYSTAQTNPLVSLMVPALERHATLNVRGRTQMKNNPEVTVRSRGVMEKCSFCIQRIREARAEAARSGVEMKDGDIVPACMEACPTGAISFGDINDSKSALSARAKDPRAMRLLEQTLVKPSISYLTKVRNDKA